MHAKTHDSLQQQEILVLFDAVEIVHVLLLLAGWQAGSAIGAVADR